MKDFLLSYSGWFELDLFVAAKRHVEPFRFSSNLNTECSATGFDAFNWTRTGSCRQQ